MDDPIKPPAPRPCKSCPYRRDVPSGVWSADEYEKLPRYDGSIPEQAYAGATAVFLCHQQDGRACAGWCGVIDPDESLALRMQPEAHLDEETFNAIYDYESPVPLFASGAEAAEHGMRDIDNPGPAARRLMDQLRRKIA